MAREPKEMHRVPKERIRQLPLGSRVIGFIGQAIGFVCIGIFFGGFGFIWGDVFFGPLVGLVFGLITFVIAGWATVRITDRIALGFVRLIHGREKVDANLGLSKPPVENAKGGNSTDNAEEPEQQNAPIASQVQATDIVREPSTEATNEEQAKDSEQTTPPEPEELPPDTQRPPEETFRKLYAEANPETGEFLAQAGTKRLRVNADTLELWAGISIRPHVERSIEIDNISSVEVSGVFSCKLTVYDAEGNEFVKVDNLWKGEAEKIKKRLA